MSGQTKVICYVSATLSPYCEDLELTFLIWICLLLSVSMGLAPLRVKM